jgi:hypothetical protein
MLSIVTQLSAEKQFVVAAIAAMPPNRRIARKTPATGAFAAVR